MTPRASSTFAADAAAVDAHASTGRAAALLAVLAVAVYGVAIAGFSRTGLPQTMAPGGHWPYLADKPLGEDGFYMLKVGWNLAAGRGLSYNGTTPTTGIQPLATFLYAAIAWVVRACGGETWAFLRAVVAISAIGFAAFALQMGRLAARLAPETARGRAAALATVLVACDFVLFRLFTYGLETGLYLALLAACVLASLDLRPGRPGARELWVGVLAGLTFWARIDYGVLFAIVLLAMLLERRIRLPQAAAIGAAAFVVGVPWLLWVHHVTGGWLPSSGGAQMKLLAAGDWKYRVWIMAHVLVDHAVAWMHTGSWALLMTAVASLAALAAWTLLPGGRGSPARRALADAAARLRPWMIATALLAGVYLVLFWAAHFYARYTSPLLVAWVPLVAVALATRVDGRGVAVASALLLACFAAQAAGELHDGRLDSSHTVTAGYIRAHYPTVKVGAYQSGIAGFFNPNVVNLDGKVEGAALAALKANRTAIWADSTGIAVVTDWPSYLSGFMASGAAPGAWVPCPVDVPNGMTRCLLRRGGPADVAR